MILEPLWIGLFWKAMTQVPTTGSNAGSKRRRPKWQRWSLTLLGLLALYTLLGFLVIPLRGISRNDIAGGELTFLFIAAVGPTNDTGGRKCRRDKA